MAEVSLSVLMGEVMSLCPDAVVMEEADGNIVIVTNMRLNGRGLLSPFDEEADFVGEDN